MSPVLVLKLLFLNVFAVVVLSMTFSMRLEKTLSYSNVMNPVWMECTSKLTNEASGKYTIRFSILYICYFYWYIFWVNFLPYVNHEHINFEMIVVFSILTYFNVSKSVRLIWNDFCIICGIFEWNILAFP